MTRETILEGGLITSHEAKPPEKTRLSTTGKKWSGPKEVGGTWGFVVDKFL